MKSDVEKKCLNCGAPLIGAFCHACGQSASVYRFSVTSFLTHDVVHGIWHIDKGILFTIKEILLRPGYAARNYISGKRKTYFNILTLAVFIIAVSLFVSNRFDTSSEFVIRKSNGKRLDDVVVNNLKFFLFSFLPIFAWCTFIFLKRLKYNYAEHLVAATFFFNGFMLLILFQKISGLIFGYDHLAWYPLYFSIQVAYLTFACYQLVHGLYSVPGVVWRILSALLLFGFLVLSIFVSIYVVLDVREFQWESK